VRLMGVADLASRFDPDALVDAAASAACVPSLAGKHPERVRARAAAIQFARDLVGIERAGQLVGSSLATTYRLAALPVAPALLAAVGRQLSLRSGAPPRKRRVRRPPICG
jgi:hypothetical protein